MDLQPLTPERGLLIATTLSALFATSRMFNGYIDREADEEPLGPNTGMYVVIGTTYTLIGALCILWILFGLAHAAMVIGILFGCFIAAGLPMLFGVQARGRRIRTNYKLEHKPYNLVESIEESIEL